MLVLTHDRNDVTTITLPDGRTMRIVIVDVRGHRVRLGYDAPKDIAIIREDAKCKEPKHI